MGNWTIFSYFVPECYVMLYTYIRCGLGLAALAHVRREELLLVLLWDLLTSSRVRPVTLGLIWAQKIY